MRLIDADAFKENIKCVCDAGGWLEPVTTAIKEYICKQVDYQTTVDAVEVVRCRDCKHLYEDDGCPLRYFKTHVEEDFCSYGERKTDG